MGDEGGLDEGGLDQLLEDRCGDFEVLVACGDVTRKLEVFDGATTAFFGRHYEPIVSGLFAHQVLVAGPTPVGEVDRFKNLTLGVAMLNLKGADDGQGDVTNERLDRLHHGGVVAVGFVGLEHGELGIVPPGEAFVAKIATNLKHLIHASDQKPLEVQLQRDAHVKLATQGVVVGLERLGSSTARNRLHHRRLHFHVASQVEEAPDFLQDVGALKKDLPNGLIGHEVEVALAVADLGVFQPMPFAGRGSQGLPERREGLHLHTRLAHASDE